MLNVSQKVCVSSPSPAVSNFCLMRSITDATACGVERKGSALPAIRMCFWVSLLLPSLQLAAMQHGGIISQSQLPLALRVQMPSAGTQDPWGCSPGTRHARSSWVVGMGPWGSWGCCLRMRPLTGISAAGKSSSHSSCSSLPALD